MDRVATACCIASLWLVCLGAAVAVAVVATAFPGMAEATYEGVLGTVPLEVFEVA
jgi:hypothetical protein